ncbi:TonB-dependent receptor domain-containing protein [Sphingobacterium tabacisoli]|uniref:TonB-dependent receptor domain-containing protein n=1 Tax=Sphingobacterium tabacisoli TaxID=2044855 RepID=A0ABW5KWJ5_9SPHI|nr:TonB-dependent receptor [Sphingobacterium tabacisoli]
MKNAFFWIITLVLYSTVVTANQRPTLRGKIVNHNNEPINGASVYLITTTARAVLKTAVTDEEGKYTILDYPSGTFIIEATAVGFGKGETAIFKTGAEGVELPNVMLTPVNKEIEAVTVMGELPLIQNVKGKMVMNVENSSVSAGNNAFEVLKRAPGVNVDKDDNISLMGRQGVNVTIDGRPTYMTGEQLATFLKSTDGGQIKSIELSSTRSAKDDAEGAAGVINIILKKNKLEGFNGSFVASVGQGERLRGNSSINLNYKKDNTTVFSNYAYTDNKTIETLNIMRVIPDGDKQTVFSQLAELKERDRTHNYKLGLEQKTSVRNTFVLQFSGNNNVENQDNPGTTNMGSAPGVIDSVMNSYTLGKEKFNKYTFNANNEFRIDTMGRTLTMDLDYSMFKTSTGLNYEYRTYFPDGETLIYAPEKERSYSLTDIKIFAVKTDYTQKIGKGNLEAGVKYSNVESDNGIKFDHLIVDSWQNNPRRSNAFNYVEQITAGYIDYSMSLNKWEAKAGLRSEYTVTDGISGTENKENKRDYLDWFPSGSLSYTKNENHVFTLNYARKISRPNYRHLNPFEYYIDKRTSMRGNPYLKPEYTNGFSLYYTLYKMFNIAIGHDFTNDAMVESMGQDTVLKTTWVTRENLGKQNTSYINLTIPARIGKFWTMYNNLTGIYMHFRGPIAGYYVSEGSTFFQLNSTSNFKINKAISSELALRYNSPFLYNVYKIQGKFNTDVGISYNLKDQRSSFKLAIADVFRSNRNNLYTKFREYDSDIRQYNDTQSIRFTFNYKFGNLKQSVRRRENSSEEKNRAQ